MASHTVCAAAIPPDHAKPAPQCSGQRQLGCYARVLTGIYAAPQCSVFFKKSVDRTGDRHSANGLTCFAAQAGAVDNRYARPSSPPSAAFEHLRHLHDRDLGPNGTETAGQVCPSPRKTPPPSKNTTALRVDPPASESIQYK
jgi:hypothetical protein